MRVATGTINHESSTFTPVPTDRRSYESRFGYLPQEVAGIGQGLAGRQAAAEVGDAVEDHGAKW